MRRIEIIGNLGSDAEKKITQGGTEVLNFSVAAKGSRKDSEAEWYRCAIFGKRAESLAGYLEKGKQVYVRGELTARPWSKDGRSGMSLDVTVDELELLGGGSSEKRESRQGHGDAYGGPSW